MRTLVDIELRHLKELDRLAQQEERSRASLIRQAIADYLGRRGVDSLEDAFGAWGHRKVDGLKYQEKVRSEW